jgi:hypothetical protein
MPDNSTFASRRAARTGRKAVKQAEDKAVATAEEKAEAEPATSGPKPATAARRRARSRDK